MKPEHFAALHRLVLSLRKFAPFRALFAFSYTLATKTFILFTTRLNRKLPQRPLVAIYLRRGGGRGELTPAASDLDFFLVLEEMDAQTEMALLKDFWSKFRYWKKFFPFLGETLMADRNELANWANTPTVRAFESKYSWQLIWGEPALEKIVSTHHPHPHLRDVLSEAMKSYWALLKPLLHEPSLEITAQDLAALQFRHAAKAAIDIFRLHRSFVENPAPEELDALWKASRAEAITLLPQQYGDLENLRNFLLLRNPLVRGPALFDFFSDLAYRAYLCLDEIASALPAREPESVVHFAPHASRSRFGQDNKYSYAVRELFTERMILRHKEYIQRTLVSASTTHIFFPFAKEPSLEKMREVLRDLREAGGSFDQSSVAIPLSERTLAEVERTSFLDNPFHAFHEHQSMEMEENGRVRSGSFVSKANHLPQNMLQKTFAEVSLALRFQPPPDFAYVIENLINLVIQLRVAEEHNLIATDFYAALEKYSERHPTRADYVREQVGRYLNLCNAEEDAFWDETIEATHRFGAKHPHRARVLKAQLEALKSTKINDPLKAMQATTDLWTEITPFLRLEMNAMRDYFFPVTAKLKL